MSELHLEAWPSVENKEFKGRILPPLPANYREPCSDNPRIKPHGSVPAHPFRDEETKQQQREMLAGFNILYRTPPKNVPKSFVRVMVDDFVINEERRKMDNYQGYMAWKALDEPVPEDLEEPLEYFEKGQATESEILSILQRTKLRKGEIFKVSHPHGYRMEQLQPARDELDEAILEHGGVIYPTVTPYRSIDVLPRVEYVPNEHGDIRQRLIGFIVKYKRDYGKVPVEHSEEIIHLVERQIAAYRVDADSGFDQTVLQAMHDFSDNYHKRIRWEDTHNPHLKSRLRRTGCWSFIENAIQTDSLEDFVVPISTTVYGHKELPSKSKALGRKMIDIEGKLAYFPRPEQKD